MLMIPLAWVVTLLSGILAAMLGRAARLPVAARGLLVAGLSGLALVGLLLGARTSLGIGWAGLVQPFVALVTIPLGYLGLAAFTVEAPYPWRRVAQTHGGAAVACMVAVAATGLFMADAVIPAQTLVYLWLLWRLRQRPAEAFVHLTAAQYQVVRAVLAMVMVLMAVVVLTDLAIFTALAVMGPQVLLRSVGTAALILTGAIVMVAVVGVPWAMARAPMSPAAPSADRSADPQDDALLARFDAMLRDTALYTDSQLTLARAARRLGVPARALSQAVNRAGGSNFSRYVNTHRVARAQHLLHDSDLPVTEVMLDSGFVSKSAFNTAFREATGQTPSAYRRSVAKS